MVWFKYSTCNTQILWKLIIILLVGLYVISSSTVWSQENKTCSATSKCVLLQHCVEFQNRITPPFTPRKLNSLKELHCGTENSSIKVCCSVLSLKKHGESLLPSPCGRPITNREFLGAGKSTLGSHPWMALLGYIESSIPYFNNSLSTDKKIYSGRFYMTDIRFNCAGSLISNRYVLTAAHCIMELPKTLFLVVVRLGEHDTSKNIDCETYRGRILCSTEPINIRIGKTVSHPFYDIGTRFNNDIALIRLKESVLFSPFIQPICLPNPGESIENDLKNQLPIITGWGITDDGQRSQVLLQLPKPYLPYRQCLHIEIYRSLLNPLTNMCLGGELGKDSCHADSGGPAIIKRSPDYNQFVQIGIISLGVGQCGKEGFPSIYTNVTNFRDWIITQLRP